MENAPSVQSRFVNVPAPAEFPPIVTPSIVPPLMSAVVTVPKSAIVVPANDAVPSPFLVNALEFSAEPSVVMYIKLCRG